MVPYRAWNASSTGLSGSSRLYSSTVRPPMLMETVVSEPSEAFPSLRPPRASVFCTANWISTGWYLSSVCSMVSPSALDRLSMLSSAPSASVLLALHAPHTIFLLCLPRIGIFFRLSLRYSSRLPLAVPMASCGPTFDHLRKVGSLRLVSRYVTSRVTRSHSGTWLLPSCKMASTSPSLSQSSARHLPPELSGTSSICSPCRSKMCTRPLLPEVAKKLPSGCQLKMTVPVP
mmetsp:Transcript_20263/g.71644  ORF Transcript_20263/g.71644 Transcript_20263/m.71644 type:complete len:231 (-) Transcript_20263:85-777(-)